MDAELSAELGRVLPSLGREEGSAGAIADERYRAHRAVSRLLASVAGDRPLVLVLDDLHWSDGASVELIGALLRRAPAAPVLLALGFRPGQVAERLGPALAGPYTRRLELPRLSEDEAGELLGAPSAGSLAAIYRHGGGNPFYLEQLSRVSNGEALPVAPDEAIGAGTGCPAPWPAHRRRARVAPGRVARLLDGAAVAGDPFELDLAAAIAELAAGTTASPRSTTCSSAIWFAPPRCRAASGSATRSFAARYTSRRAEAGGLPPTRGRRTPSPPAAPRPPSAPTTWSSRRAQGDEDAIELLLEAGRGGRRARARRGRGLVRRRPLRLLPSGTQTGRCRCAPRSPPHCDRSASWNAVEPRCSRRSSCCRQSPWCERVELTTLCAAVEHWLGRHDEAHRRLRHAWDEVPDRGTRRGGGAADRAGGRRAVPARLRADAGHGLEALETARVARRLPADRVRRVRAVRSARPQPARSRCARAHREEAVALVDRLSDRRARAAPRGALLPGLGRQLPRALRRGHRSRRSRNRDRAGHRRGEAAGAADAREGLPARDHGRLAEASELCDAAVEAARLSANPHNLFWALFELGWAHYYLGDLDAAERAARRAPASGGRLAGSTMPAASGGPGLAAGRHALRGRRPEARRSS